VIFNLLFAVTEVDERQPPTCPKQPNISGVLKEIDGQTMQTVDHQEVQKCPEVSGTSRL